MRRHSLIAAALACGRIATAHAQDQQAAPPQTAAPAPASGFFEVASEGVTLITGDIWQQEGWTVRLFGVQSCIRGTSYTNPAGEKQDCGEASALMLGAMLKDMHPQCRPLSRSGPDATSSRGTLLVVCVANVGQNQIDLGTALILKGYDFASILPDGKPIYPSYAVAESSARKDRAGLWAAPDLPYPNAIISKALRGK